MQVKTAAAPQTDYLVLTKCGRRFAWSACDMDSLFRDLQFNNYEATFVKPMSEYEAEIEAKEQQEALMHEFHTELERELKESA